MAAKKAKKPTKKKQKPQTQKHQPGDESEMVPRPEFMPRFPGAGKLNDKVVLITGGDSGIGRAVSVLMAREGADIVIVYLDEHDDAAETVAHIEKEGRRALAIAGDIGHEKFCIQAVKKAVAAFGRIDILINNAAEQHESETPLEIPEKQLLKTFSSNVFGYFFMTKAALKHMGEDAVIINTTSITAFEGHKTLIDYAATRGAIVAFTRSLSQALMERKIRVNAVAPGPIWTPLIPSSFDPQHVAEHGTSSPMGRAGQPNEVAPSYLFLACADSSYMSGQILHPNGGTVTGS